MSMQNFEKEFKHVRIALNRAKLISKEFDILFNDDDNLEVLRSGAENFFGLIYHEFQESMMMYLFKLSDPAIQGKNNNLSAEHFLKTEEVKSSKYFSDIQDIYNEKVKPARKRMIDYRNKYGMHSDYSTVMNLDITRPGYNDILQLLESLEEYFGKIGSCILGATYIFGGMGDLNAGAGYLVCLLKKAKKC
jgi:hypothetical protein